MRDKLNEIVQYNLIKYTRINYGCCWKSSEASSPLFVASIVPMHCLWLLVSLMMYMLERLPLELVS